MFRDASEHSEGSNIRLDLFLVILLLFLTAVFRLYALGYSEYQDDEKKAVLLPSSSQTIKEFLLTRRKGPGQFLVTSATMRVLTGDWVSHSARDVSEFSLRLPFALMNLVSIAIVYLAVKRYTRNRYSAFLAGLLYGFNGFVIAFSRIAQYQNLNLLFSALSLYFGLDLLSPNLNRQRVWASSLLSSLFFAFSLLSHWDAIYVVVPLALIWLKFLVSPVMPVKTRFVVFLGNLVLALLVVAPFLVPYIQIQLHSTSNVAYFNRRVGHSSYPLFRHLFIFRLYNPYMLLEFLGMLSLAGVLFIKKLWPILLWFLVDFALLKLFMTKPGTHIYNYVLPALLFASLSFGEIVKQAGRWWKLGLFLASLPYLGLFAYQNYILFLDHSLEYPWRSKQVLQYITVPYREKEVLTFGFPHYRAWRLVDDIISNDPDNCTYVTNEGKEISQIYMRSKYGILDSRTCHYVVIVKYPFISTRDNYSYPGITGKDPVFRYKVGDETLTKVYKIYQK